MLEIVRCRMNRICGCLILILGLLFTAASVRAADWTNKIPDSALTALESAQQFELLSLDPNFDPDRRPKEEFHGWRSLGRIVVNDAETRDHLVRALKKSVEERKGKGVPKCFNPRHGIRVTRDGKTNDLVICFECLQVKTFENDKRGQDFLIGESAEFAESLFNRVLTKRRIPFAGK